MVLLFFFGERFRVPNKAVDVDHSSDEEWKYLCRVKFCQQKFYFEKSDVVY
jgi:hypothetical protein